MWQLVWCATAACWPVPAGKDFKDLPDRLLYPTQQECQLAAEAENQKHRTAMCIPKSDEALFPPVPGVAFGLRRS
jgi:hypothetical protein